MNTDSRMAGARSRLTGAEPVFVPTRKLPPEHEKQYTTREICGACEHRAGFGAVIGAQRMGALWRIYPKDNECRMKLLLSGIGLRGALVSLNDKNPFLIRADSGEEVLTTKCVISNIPISYSNQEIEEMIVNLGGKPRSQLLMERDRDDSGQLTRWLTGRRYMFIEVPHTPLPTKAELGPFRPSIWHYEQKRRQTSKCGRCFEGHLTTECPNGIKCLQCGLFGHKKGAPECSLRSENEKIENVVSTTMDVTDDAEEEDSERDEVAEKNTMEDSVEGGESVDAVDDTMKDNADGGNAGGGNMAEGCARELSSTRTEESASSLRARLHRFKRNAAPERSRSLTPSRKRKLSLTSPTIVAASPSKKPAEQHTTKDKNNDKKEKTKDNAVTNKEKKKRKGSSDREEGEVG